MSPHIFCVSIRYTCVYIISFEFLSCTFLNALWAQSVMDWPAVPASCPDWTRPLRSCWSDGWMNDMIHIPSNLFGMLGETVHTMTHRRVLLSELFLCLLSKNGICNFILAFTGWQSPECSLSIFLLVLDYMACGPLGKMAFVKMNKT